MERRVRLVVMLLLLCAVVSLSVPLALTQAERRTSALGAERDRQLQVLTEQALVAPDPGAVVARYEQVYGEPVLVTDPDGRVLAQAGTLAVDDPAVSEALRLRLVDDPSRDLATVLPWTTTDPLRGVTLTERGEVRGVALTRVDTARAAGDLRRSWALLVGVGLLLVLLALAVARQLSRWTVRPVHSLEQAARRLGRGERGERVLPSGPVELRELVREFDRMRDAVHRSLDDQRRLVADASHQLRNPLAAVRLRADSLRTHLEPSGRRTHESLVTELDRLEQLLDQLLSLARAQEAAAGRRAGREPTPELSPAGDVVGDRVDAWLPVARARGQELSAGAVADVGVPGLDLGQVLDVLLGNATSYAGDGARIRVAAGAADGSLVLRVGDDGPGLGAEDLAAATQRFWRGGADHPGTGIGLAIADEVVTGHGGRLTLRASEEGGVLAEVVWPLPSPGGAAEGHAP